MKILVYDSGISMIQKEYITATDVGAGILDEAHHGSVVCDIIKLLAPASEIVSIKILDSDNTATLEVLISALEKGLDSECDIICLALAVECSEDCLPLREIITELDRSGKTVICSNMNRSEYSFPAIYSNVIGCGIRYSSSDSRLFASDRLIQSSLPVLAAWRRPGDEGFLRLTGNSLSCAVMAGEAAYILDTEEVRGRKALESRFESMEWKDYRFYKNSSAGRKLQDTERYNEVSRRIRMVLDNYGTDTSYPLYMSRHLEPMLNDIFSGEDMWRDDIILQPSDIESVFTLARFICCSSAVSCVKYNKKR